MEISKYHGCGNDFLITLDQPLAQAQKRQLVITLCDRHIGIGADGFIFVSLDPLTMEFYNCDGSRAAMCGNGIRCLADYLWEEGLVKKQHYTVQCGPHQVEVKCCGIDPFQAAIGLGTPSLAPDQIQSSDHRIIWNRSFTIQGHGYIIDTLYITTIHTVIFVEDDPTSYEAVGAALHCHPLFAAKTNVDFARIIDRCHIRMATYERGVGMTNACGTGCAAVAWDAWKRGYVDHEVTFIHPYGMLQVHIDPISEAVTLIGGAQRIISGTVDPKYIAACQAQAS